MAQKGSPFGRSFPTRTWIFKHFIAENPTRFLRTIDTQITHYQRATYALPFETNRIFIRSTPDVQNDSTRVEQPLTPGRKRLKIAQQTSERITYALIMRKEHAG